MRILLIEDDDRTAEYVRKGLHEAGHTVDRAAEAVEGEFLATSEPYGAIVVDRGITSARCCTSMASVSAISGAFADTSRSSTRNGLRATWPRVQACLSPSYCSTLQAASGA